ncbi:hypothetical protein FSH69_023270, partial [Escherichia coli]|nr:hypothetical protein [Escherichia coli]
WQPEFTDKTLSRKPGAVQMDSNRAWNKADTPSKAIHAEIELRELIKVVVDKHMAPKLAGNIRSFTRNQMVKIERQAIIEAWQEWEAYQ